jgi:outer membrane receptor for ferrienterochelin and colicin
LKLSIMPLLCGAFLLIVPAKKSACAEGDLPSDSSIASEELRFLQEEQVTIAAQHEQPISEAAGNVYVITDEDIRHSGEVDLPSVLRRVPGMEVMQMTGADFNVSVRGDNQPLANKLLVMVDGRPIYVDAHGNVYWKAIPVTLPEIKRIEVLKGPSSAVYGFNAFDGVVNIITKSPEEMKGATLQFGGGSFGTLTSAAIYAGTEGRFGYRFSAGRDQTQQWRNSDALAFRSHKFNLHTEYALTSESKLTASGGLWEVNRYDGAVQEQVFNATRPSQAHAQLTYQRPNFFIQSWWNAYYAEANITPNPRLASVFRVTDRNMDPVERTVSHTYNILSQHTVELHNTNQFSYGVNYRYITLSDNFMNAYGYENRLGFYVNDEWHPLPKLNIQGGVRYDLDTHIHPTVSPRLALIYKLAPEHSFRASMSVAYRPPTLAEKHLDTLSEVSLPFGTSIINLAPLASLKPEKIVSYEIEYQGWYFKHRVRLRTALFFNHITDLITSRLVSANTAIFTNDPGQADIYGGEAGVEFMATTWLSGFANVSYEEIGQSFTDTTARAAPRLKGSAGLRAEWDNGVSGQAALYHVGGAVYPIAATFTRLEPFGVIPPDPRVGSYNLLNIRLAYLFWRQKAAAGYIRDAEVAFSAFNALSDKHKEHPLGENIGSRVMGWLTLKF